MSTAIGDEEKYPESYPKVFWVGLVLGWAVIGVGVRGLLLHAHTVMPTNPRRWIVVLVGSNLVHDFVLLPVVFVAGRILRSVAPPRLLAPLQVGLICSSVVALFSYPLVRDFGHRPDNPTILPRDAAHGLVVVLAAVWIAVIVASALRRKRPRP